MANSIPDPLIFPDPHAYGVGRELLSATWLHLAGALNYLIAEGGTQTLVHQSWPDENCRLSHDTGAWIAATIPWRLPILSADHEDLEVLVLAKGAGSFRLHSAAGNIGPTVAVAAGTPTLYQTTAQISPTNPEAMGGDYDDLTLEIQAEDPDELTILSISVSVKPLTSPLPAGEVAGCIPQGIASIVAGKPLPACRGQEFIQSLEAIMGRPRVVFAWAALSAAVVAYDQAQGGEAQAVMAPILHRSMMLENLEAEELLTVWVQGRGDPAEDREVRMGIHGRGYTLPAGTGDVWGVQPASDPKFLRWEEFYRPEGPRHPFRRIEMDPTRESAAEILSMTLWSRR